MPLSLLKVPEQLQPSFSIARSIRATFPRHQPSQDMIKGSRHCSSSLCKTAQPAQPTPPQLCTAVDFSSTGVSPMGWESHPLVLLKTVVLYRAPCVYTQTACLIWSVQRCSNSWKLPLGAVIWWFPCRPSSLGKEGSGDCLNLTALMCNFQLSLGRIRPEGRPPAHNAKGAAAGCCCP